VANRKTNISGSIVITRACIGSAGCGFSFVWRYIVPPMSSGQMPIMRKAGGVKGSRPKRLNRLVGSGADRSLIQP
jgi:hypothetical protein